ncbi:cation-dependent mannose-6-phosphate receptor-like isoform X2 [Lineus longissimus]|uniref:cation-dependent mannose-6-phosphate receptor-like isoform X2 n=1 Tax=Lineus longissimus TaxID=88925 RepID=UPI002B4F19BF
MSDFSAFSAKSTIMIPMLFILSVIRDVTAIKCVYRSPCSCQMADGSGMINLNSLAAVKGAPPTFLNITGNDGNLYSFNPCIAFTVYSSDCKNVALCTFEKKHNKYTGLGTEESASFVYDDHRKRTLLKFSSEDIVTHVSLQCHQERTELKVEGQVNETFYYMTLLSPCACLDGCIERLSLGSIILITGAFLLFTYLLVGVLYNRAVYNSVGRELLPNYEFWADMPSLIKDGYLFFISPCLGDRVEYRHYERL